MSGIERHRTALHRTELSRPVRLALDDGVLARGESFFDYGCGRGADIAHLKQRGFEADGWDPAHRPGNRSPADVVNLGYVVNVIEDPDERLATLQDAWHLAQQVLVVSARLETDRRSWFGPTLGDGSLTRLGTFQKYFAQDELSAWVNEATGAGASRGGAWSPLCVPGFGPPGDICGSPVPVVRTATVHCSVRGSLQGKPYSS